MKKLLLLTGLLAASLPANAALLQIDPMPTVEVFRYWVEGEDRDYVDYGRSFVFSFNVYGTLTLTEEDAFASPVVVFPTGYKGRIDGSFISAEQGETASFVGAGTRTGLLGRIDLNVWDPDFIGFNDTRSFNLITGVGRTKNAASWLPSSADQSSSILYTITPPRQGEPPVPEPASLAVLGVGALALLRRKRKA